MPAARIQSNENGGARGLIPASSHFVSPGVPPVHLFSRGDMGRLPMALNFRKKHRAFLKTEGMCFYCGRDLDDHGWHVA